MKRVFSLLFIFLITTHIVAIAQPRAIGGRLGCSIGPSYQHQIGEKNMIQADIDFLGYGLWGVQGTVTFNWIIPLKSWETANWNLYTGVGIGGGYEYAYGRTLSVFLRPGYSYLIASGFIGLAGIVGLEWNFKLPLQLSVEYRPLCGIRIFEKPHWEEKNRIDVYYHGLWASAIAVSVRYKFGEK